MGAFIAGLGWRLRAPCNLATSAQLRQGKTPQPEAFLISRRQKLEARVKLLKNFVVEET
jgi:hypothetical protein